MEIFYSPYEVTPLARANHLSTLSSKPGIYLRTKIGDSFSYADYFPHTALGDRSVEEFLEGFKDQAFEYEQKVFSLLKADHRFQKLTPKKIKNHKLWTGHSTLEGRVVKYKLLSPNDDTFKKVLELGLRLRLDANGILSRKTLSELLSTIPESQRHLIDYVEDPTMDLDWRDLGIPTAQDFLDGSSSQFYIYKPNCEFYPETDQTIIFSSYLGGNLGNWHAYCELIENGDIDLFHGIKTEGFLKEEIPYLQGDYSDHFLANSDYVHKIYKDLESREWKKLCSM